MEDPWSRLSERVVMVSRYNERDGITRYAEQLIAADRGGRTFLRVGLLEGPGDYHRTFDRGPRALWLLRDARRGDDIVVHWHPHHFIRGGALNRVVSHLSWGVLALSRRVTIVAHEPDPAGGSRLEEAARRWAWRQAGRVIVHSDWEARRHTDRFGTGRRQEVVVVEHGDFFSTSVAQSREDARDALGLRRDRTILLMIGFISASFPDKGYDRAIEAVRAAGVANAELHIVGTPIRDDDEVRALLERLRAAAAASPSVVLHETFVDDERFDLWVRAADAVLTPYRTSSSSGVVARAHLLGTRVVMSDAGGLPAQARDGDIVVHDDAELVDAVRRVAAER